VDTSNQWHIFVTGVLEISVVGDGFLLRVDESVAVVHRYSLAKKAAAEV